MYKFEEGEGFAEDVDEEDEKVDDVGRLFAIDEFELKIKKKWRFFFLYFLHFLFLNISYKPKYRII